MSENHVTALLKAEKEVSDNIRAAIKNKNDKMRMINTEAKKEVDKYTDKKEREYQAECAKVSDFNVLDTLIIEKKRNLRTRPKCQAYLRRCLGGTGIQSELRSLYRSYH